ncbi:CYTH domain-containing protein [Kitasatospora sp. NPDC059577]|uniref:CYTH domain-containing protein n=1 Tax=unclassified Kitasatospora TaxID=2633591 RepID=UPI003679539D
MSTEIERKFKVAEDWRVPPQATAERLRQAYLTPSGAPVEFRVRAGEGTRLMTAKTFDPASGAMVRQEVEFPVADEVFDQLWDLAGGECLSKVRWSVPLDGHLATVDEYDGALTGLRVVEVEFADVEAARAFVPPHWFGEEITGSPAWSNRELAARARTGQHTEGENR